MEYAIIKSGNDALLKVIKLSDWFSWEWDDFATVKEKSTNEIKWFFYEEEAVEFMLSEFPKHMINPKYFDEVGYSGEYYID